jgi:hypothetical protein
VPFGVAIVMGPVVAPAGTVALKAERVALRAHGAVGWGYVDGGSGDDTGSEAPGEVMGCPPVPQPGFRAPRRFVTKYHVPQLAAVLLETTRVQGFGVLVVAGIEAPAF